MPTPEQTRRATALINSMYASGYFDNPNGGHPPSMADLTAFVSTAYENNYSDADILNSVKAQWGAGASTDQTIASTNAAVSGDNVMADAIPDTYAQARMTSDGTVHTTAPPAGGSGPSSDASSYIAKAMTTAGFRVLTDTNGDVHVFDPNIGSSGDETIFHKQADGSYAVAAKPGGVTGGGAITAGEQAQIGLGYAKMNADNANSAADRAQRSDEFNKNYQTGIDQFNKTYDRSVFTTDRAYQQAQDQFATTFAEGKRQFDESQSGINSRFQIGETGLNTRAAAAEAGTQTRFDTSEARMNTAMGLQNDQFNSRLGFDAQTEHDSLIMQAAKMAGDAATADREANLKETAQRADILRKPSDFLARAYASRGEISPMARVTHADLINHLNESARVAQGERGTAAAEAARIAAAWQGPRMTTMPVAAGPQQGAAPAKVAPVVAPGPDQWAGPTGETAHNTMAAPTAADLYAQINAQSPGGQAAGGVARLASGGEIGGEQRTAAPQQDDPNAKVAKLLKSAMGLYVDAAEATGRPVNPGEAVRTVSRMMHGEAPSDDRRHRDQNDAGGMSGNGVLRQKHGSIPAGQARFADQHVDTSNVEDRRGQPGPWMDGEDRWAPTTQEAAGGNARMAIVGDDPSGQPTGHEELLIANGPAQVIPLNARGLAAMKKKGTKGAAAGMATDLYNGTYDPSTNISQDELVAGARTFAPPGVKSVVGGARMAPYRAAEPNLSPRRINAMTPGEQEALNTYLGVVDNTTLADEQAGMASTFGKVVTGPRARLVNY